MKTIAKYVIVGILILCLLKVTLSPRSHAPKCGKELLVTGITVTNKFGKHIEVAKDESVISIIARGMSEAEDCDYIGFYSITYKFHDNSKFTCSANYKVAKKQGNSYYEDFLSKAKIGDKIMFNCTEG